MQNDRNWLWGGVASSAALILAWPVFGLDLPLVGFIGIMSFGATTALLGLPAFASTGSRLPGAHRPSTSVERSDTPYERLGRQLRRSLTRIRGDALVPTVESMSNVLDDILVQIERSPSHANRVQRLLTYYLPHAVQLVESYADMAGDKHEQSRKEIGDLLVEVEKAFHHYADAMDDTKAMLGVDMRLVRNSLDEDLNAMGRSIR